MANSSRRSGLLYGCRSPVLKSGEVRLEQLGELASALVVGRSISPSSSWYHLRAGHVWTRAHHVKAEARVPLCGCVGEGSGVNRADNRPSVLEREARAYRRTARPSSPC